MTCSWPLRLSVCSSWVIRINADSQAVRQKEDSFGESVFFLMPSPGQTQGRYDLNSFNAIKTPSDPFWTQTRHGLCVCVEKKWNGSYFTILAIQEWFIFQMKTDWRHKHRQAHATWMLLNGLVLAGWCEVGMIHRAAVVLWCAVLCCDRAAIMLPAREMLVFHRSALNSPQNSVWECLFTSC